MNRHLPHSKLGLRDFPVIIAGILLASLFLMTPCPVRAEVIADGASAGKHAQLKPILTTLVKTQRTPVKKD